MVHKEGIAGSYRLVPSQIKTLEELGFPAKDAKTIRRLLDYNNGLILVTGPLGSGKTTTLAAMINVLNEKRQDHVITVEDPIEIIQHSKGCQITQRQIGSHTQSYRTALKGALREDPDIIVIGEMNDLETIENAITASETGHLVIGTLSTCDAANTLNRVLDVFPPSQQAQIRAMTAGSLRGILCQRLVPGADGTLKLAYEILINTNAVSNNINEGKIHQLKAAMEIGQKQGMLTIDQCLLAHYEAESITYEVALRNMRDASVLEQLNKLHAVREAKKLAGQAS
jgi:twitching motility protein PilT